MGTAMNHIIDGVGVYATVAMFLISGGFGWRAYYKYAKGDWKRWTIRLAVIACLSLNFLLILRFIAMGFLGTYVGRWDKYSTALFVVCMIGVFALHFHILKRDWNAPVKLDKE